MDTITAVIVTAFLNLAISTGVFLRVQKNIELSFQKQLEAFKTELQKDVIEHQVRFSKTYPKNTEILETINQMFLDIREMIRDLELEKDERTEAVNDAVADFRSYIAYNRFYLPTNIGDCVARIAGEVYGLSFVILWGERHYELPISQLETVAVYAHAYSEYSRDIRPSGETVDKWVVDAYNKLDVVGRELESLYKTITETP